MKVEKVTRRTTLPEVNIVHGPLSHHFLFLIQNDLLTSALKCMNRKCIGGKYQYLPSRLFILPADSYSQSPKRLSLNIYTKKQYHIRFFWYPSHMYHSTLDFQDASTLHNLLCYHSVYNVSIFSFLLFWTPRIVFYFVFYFTSVLSNSAGYVPRTLYGTVSAWGTIG